MNKYYLRSIHLISDHDVAEDVYDSELPALIKLRTLEYDMNCVAAEVEWWKDDQPQSLNGIVLIGQAVRNLTDWNIRFNPKESFTRGHNASQLLKVGRETMLHINLKPKNVTYLYPAKPFN